MPARAENERDERFLSTMRLGCVAAIAISILLVTASFLVQRSLIEQEASSSLVIAYAADQRMLSQRATLLSLSLLSTSDTELRDRIRRSLRSVADAMASAQDKLTGQDPSGQFQERITPEVARLYYEEPNTLDAKVRSFIESVRRFTESPNDSYTFENPHVRAITGQSAELLDLLGTLTQLYSEQGRAGIYGLERAGMLLLFITILALLVTGLFIFWPILRRLRNELAQRSSIEQQLHRSTLDLQRYAEALESSNTELEQFANIVAHDLRAPLRTLMGFSEHLSEQLKDTELGESREYLGFIGTAAARMDQLVSDLLLYSRVTAGDIERSWINLNELLQEVLDDLSATIERKEAIVTLEPMPQVYGNQTQLRQLFQNLIQNGLKFSRNETVPKIRVFIEDHSDVLRLAVEDNGIGFEQNHAERIFQIFRRLHSEKDYEGSGVGLAICQKVAKIHGGRMTAKGTPGVGATFYVEFPKTYTANVSTH